MFSIPQPCDQEIIEGCPVVDVPDNANDFTRPLRAIYEPTYFAFHEAAEASESISFEDLASILRLSAKYDIHLIRWKCIDEFKSMFPCTLKEFDALGYGVSQFHLSAAPESFRLGGDGCLSSALLLFRECDVPELLPSLFYILTRGSLAETLSRLRDFPKSEILGCILLGREKLLSAQLNDIFPYFLNFKPSPNCLCPAKCQELGLERKEEGHIPGSYQWALTNVAHWFEKPVSCSPCHDFYKAYKSARQRVWNELPDYFELGTWEEIRNIK